MELNGEQRINATQAQVWRALEDPQILKQCIPMCESVEKQAEGEFAVAMTAAVGPVKAKFKAKLQYIDVQAPDRCSMRFEAQGGPAGFGKGEAHLTLTPVATGTVLSYRVKAQIGGKLAQIGSRLVDAAASRVADEFFTQFNAIVATPASETADTPPSASVPESRSKLWWAVSIGAGLVLVILLVYVLRH
jgi:carbon monoxide dehydrogenase subunit G